MQTEKHGRSDRLALTKSLLIAVWRLCCDGLALSVTCESELTAVEGRKLVFKVSLYDEKGPVGGGVHERFVVNDAKFAAKAESKKG